MASRPEAATSLIAYIRKVEARAARLYNDARPDDSRPWRELPPVERHEWIKTAKARSDI